MQACFLQVLQRLCAVIVQHSWEFSTDRNATHVARRLLCVLAGRDVLPAQANSHEVSGAAYSAASKVCSHCWACP